MPPTRNTAVKAPTAAAETNQRTTRSKTSLNAQEAQDAATNLVVKRKAEGILNAERKKRSALGNLTNANIYVNKTTDTKQLKDVGKVEHEQKVGLKKVNIVKSTVHQQNENVPKFSKPTGPTARPPVHSKIQTRANSKVTGVVQQERVLKAAPLVATETKKNAEVPKTVRRLSNEFEKSENSLYVSALETIPSQPEEDETADDSLKSENVSEDSIIIEVVPDDVHDFDKENEDDPYQVSVYAMHIFEYMKSREPMFQIKDYLPNQKNLTVWMRALLIDWMVEVQESFELNHETLYLAVKLVDRYLYFEHHVHKDRLQLLGAAALLIACKYDERIPPAVEDFLYICDGAYTQEQLLQQEIKVFKTIGFDLGIPISYRFLRRYARCAKVPMKTLTLARFILEYSLMDYATVTLSDSKLASAALFIALRMMNEVKPWTKTLEFYTGYKLQQFSHIVALLNENLLKKPKDTLITVRNKYSHAIFHEVAKLPLMKNEALFKDYPEVSFRDTEPISV